MCGYAYECKDLKESRQIEFRVWRLFVYVLMV